eukprot:120210-Chlamydomonas_euryale.AAC.1
MSNAFRPVGSGRKATLDAVPAARDEVANVLTAMRAGGRPVTATTVRALVSAWKDMHLTCWQPMEERS